MVSPPASLVKSCRFRSLFQAAPASMNAMLENPGNYKLQVTFLAITINLLRIQHLSLLRVPTLHLQKVVVECQIF